MSDVKGFKFENEVHQYDYDYLTHKPVPDKTLKIEGQSADAKAVGDLIKVSATQPTTAATKVWVESQTTDVEIPTYAEHEALASEVSTLKEDLTNTVGNKLLRLQDVLVKSNIYIRPSDGANVSSQNYNTSDFIAVKAGNHVKCALAGTGTVAVLAFYSRASIDSYTSTNIVGVGASENYEFTFIPDADGFIRICNNKTNKNGYVYVQEDVPDGIRLQIAELSQNVETLDTTAKKNAETVDGELLGLSDVFEVGSISATTSGWTYSTATKRIRTKENVTISLEAGDTLYFKDYSNIRYYVGYRTNNGSYGTGSTWLQKDFIAKRRGEYVLTASYYPETTLTFETANALAKMFGVKRCFNAQNSMLLNNANVIGVNHRGFNEVAPENTMPAFILSKEKGFSFVETDISFTSDNVPVLLHDETIDRTSNGSGSISEMTYAQVSEYDFGSWKDEKYTGTKIPTLEEFLLFCKQTGMRAFLELKTNGSSQTNVEYCALLVKKYGLLDKMVWISFSATLLEYIKESIPTATLGLCASTITDSLISSATSLINGENRVFIGSSPTEYTSDNVEKMITAGIDANAYTLDNLSNIIDLDPYVSYITTNSINIEYALLALSGHKV